MKSYLTLYAIFLASLILSGCLTKTPDVAGRERTTTHYNMERAKPDPNSIARVADCKGKCGPRPAE